MDFSRLKNRMVEEQLIARNIKDKMVLDAFRNVPRHLFVNPKEAGSAYDDRPLPIGYGQTISQPYIVALMVEQLKLNGDDIVLEIGTGSGYEAAVLAELAKEVYTIDRISELTKRAEAVFEELRYVNIHTKIGDGTLGWPEHSPYDAIIVSAASPAVPDTLIEQLKDGGCMILPVGDTATQTLTLVTKSRDTFTSRELTTCIFVPLLGKYGWRA